MQYDEWRAGAPHIQVWIQGQTVCLTELFGAMRLRFALGTRTYNPSVPVGTTLGTSWEPTGTYVRTYRTVGASHDVRQKRW
jgi:hypothetical protein